MKVVIIGTPGKGKTTLANKLRETYPDAAMISLGSLRNPLGIHEPHMGYETEVSPKNTLFFRNIVDNAMLFHKNCIVEGYGLAPEDAFALGKKHNCPTILLCHKNTSAEEDFLLMKKYDSKSKWTARRSDDYLKKLFSFYKEVEKSWVTRTPDNFIFSTDMNFQNAIDNAYNFVISFYGNK